jgi:hypothetical protein
MTDYLEVKAIRTFAVGKDLKTKKSEPFTVEAGEAKLLEAQGLVTIVGDAEAPVVEDVEPPVIATERPKRKGKADAANEGS